MDNTTLQPSDSGHNVGEVDTSAPFESVKEAVTRFGGIGFWKPHSHLPQNGVEEVFDAAKIEAHATQLENDLKVKERETLEVLKELEATKTTVEELKVKLQKETAEVNAAIHNHPSDEAVGQIKQNDENVLVSDCLMELKQAKLNLARTTSDLADIRATVETFNKKIEKERLSLEKTRQRLSLNSSKIANLEEEISQTQHQLETAKGSEDPFDLPRELHRLTSETEQFKKVGDAAKSEVLRVINGMEESKIRIKTAEIRLNAARKLKEAAKASEALARSEIKALTKSQSQTLSEGDQVTLSFEEYTSLTSKAREAEEASKKRVDEALEKVNKAEWSKSEILKRVEEATEEVKSSKQVLEEALSRVEAANDEKLKVEEGLRKWRSEHSGHRRKSSVHNSTKFKNSSAPPPHLRSNPRLFDVTGTHVAGNGPGPVLTPTMSIGQILSRKLFLTEEYSEKRCSEKSKVSLAQMLSKPSSGGGGEKRLPTKRKKFGLGRISFLVAKPSKKKKKKKHSSNLGLSYAKN